VEHLCRRYYKGPNITTLSAMDSASGRRRLRSRRRHPST
jgi:hypothetical protein